MNTKDLLCNSENYELIIDLYNLPDTYRYHSYWYNCLYYLCSGIEKRYKLYIDKEDFNNFYLTSYEEKLGINFTGKRTRTLLYTLVNEYMYNIFEVVEIDNGLYYGGYLQLKDETTRTITK